MISLQKSADKKLEIMSAFFPPTSQQKITEKIFKTFWKYTLHWTTIDQACFVHRPVQYVYCKNHGSPLYINHWCAYTDKRPMQYIFLASLVWIYVATISMKSEPSLARFFNNRVKFCSLQRAESIKKFIFIFFYPEIH